MNIQYTKASTSASLTVHGAISTWVVGLRFMHNHILDLGTASLSDFRIHDSTISFRFDQSYRHHYPGLQNKLTS
jgi:hypothetical protein